MGRDIRTWARLPPAGRSSPRPEWRWLEPPEPNGELTIFDVAVALGSDDAPRIVERYVRSVWAAWAQQHDTVEAWARPFIR